VRGGQGERGMNDVILRHVFLLWLAFCAGAGALWCVQLVDTIAEIQERHDAVGTSRGSCGS